VPDVPTFVEQGFSEPTFRLPLWVAIAAPAALKRKAPIVAGAMRAAGVQPE